MKAVRAIPATLAATGILAVGACSSGGNGGAASGTNASVASPGVAASCTVGTLNGAGSTFQQNMELQWAKDFAARCKNASINYQGIGSGAGIEQFGNGTVDFAGSDVVMKPAERAKADQQCKSPAIHLPITAGGVAIIYNLPGVKALKLSAKTLAGIFQGSITRWNDPAIAADNPGESLPSTPVSVFYRSDGSGTTQVFSEFEASQAKDAWRLGTGKTLQWPAGQGKKGSDGVTAGVKQTTGGITYAEASFAMAGKLPVAAVKGSGEFVELNAANVSKAIAGFQVSGTGSDLAGSVDYGTASGYPISTVSYVIACTASHDAAKANLLKAYLTYAVTAGQRDAEALGFAPLPASLVARDQASIAGLS